MGNIDSRVDNDSGQLQSNWNPKDSYEMATWIVVLRNAPAASCIYTPSTGSITILTVKEGVGRGYKNFTVLEGERDMAVKDLSKCKSKYLLMNIGINLRARGELDRGRGDYEEYQGGVKSFYFSRMHAVVVIVNLAEGTFDIFDPQGSARTPIVKFGVHNEVKHFIESRFILPPHAAKEFKYDHESQCPRFGPQFLIGSSIGSPGGICRLWAHFIVYWHLKHPNQKMPEFGHYSSGVAPRDWEMYAKQPEKYQKITAILKEFEKFHDDITDLYNETLVQGDDNKFKQELILKSMYDELTRKLFIQGPAAAAPRARKLSVKVRRDSAMKMPKKALYLNPKRERLAARRSSNPKVRTNYGKPSI